MIISAAPFVHCVRRDYNFYTKFLVLYPSVTASGGFSPRIHGALRIYFITLYMLMLQTHQAEGLFLHQAAFNLRNQVSLGRLFSPAEER